MSKPLAKRIPFAKIATVLAIAIGVSLGLCGVGAVTMGNGDGTNFRSIAGQWIFGAGAVIFWLSVLGLLLTFLVWFVWSLFTSGD